MKQLTRKIFVDSKLFAYFAVRNHGEIKAFAPTHRKKLYPLYRIVLLRFVCLSIKLDTMKKFRTFLIMTCLAIFALSISAQHRQVGKATYYSKRAHGAMTASGERLHRDSFTCAHRTLPFGTMLKVKDLNSGKEVIVKVTDRGPYGRGRVIDLSYAAAKEIGLLQKGVSSVEITQWTDKGVIPYKVNADVEIPQFEVASPDGEGYCLLSQWAEKKHQQAAKKLSAQAKAKKPSIRKIKKDSVPRWKVFDKLCAKSENEGTKEFRYILK